MLTETIAKWTVATQTFRLMLVKLAYFPTHICLQLSNTLHLESINIHKPETVHKFLLKAHPQSKHLTVKYSSQLVTGPCCHHQYQTMVLLQLIQAGEVGEERCPELIKTKETTETHVFLSVGHTVLCVAWRHHTVLCVAWRHHTVFCVAWRHHTALCVAWRHHTVFCVAWRCRTVLCVAWRHHTVLCVAWRGHTVLCVAWRCNTGFCVAWRVTESPIQTDTLWNAWTNQHHTGNCEEHNQSADEMLWLES